MVDREDDKVTAHSDSVALEGEAVVVVVAGCRSQPHPAAEK